MLIGDWWNRNGRWMGFPVLLRREIDRAEKCCMREKGKLVPSHCSSASARLASLLSALCPLPSAHHSLRGGEKVEGRAERQRQRQSALETGIVHTSHTYDTHRYTYISDIFIHICCLQLEICCLFVCVSLYLSVLLCVATHLSAPHYHY